MYLYIDTTEKDSFMVGLIAEEKVIKKKTIKSHRQHSEKLLKSIERILLSNKSSLKDVKGIVVVKGPGSFTSLRIGIATANALAFGLGVPIQGVGKTDSIETIFKGGANIIIPEYGQAPHITASKK